MSFSTLFRTLSTRLCIAGMTLVAATFVASVGWAQVTREKPAKPAGQPPASYEDAVATLTAEIKKLEFEESPFEESMELQAELAEKRAQLKKMQQIAEPLTPKQSLVVKRHQVADAERAVAFERAKKAAEQLALAKKAYDVQRVAQQRSLPPIENGEIKVFSLVNLQAADVTKTIENLFGAEQMRLAVDDRTNTLIAFGTSDSLAAVEALLLRLDQEVGEKSTEKTPSGPAAPTRSLLLRVFWLADNLPDGEGQEPDEYLPKKVVAATERLGLVKPRLVAQTVNSLAVDGGGDGQALGRGQWGPQAHIRNVQEYTTRIPAIVFGQTAELKCNGTLSLAAADRTTLEMQIAVAGGTIDCELSGSVSAPLGHYMVLGTANSVVAPQAMMAGGMGMGWPPGEEDDDDASGAFIPTDPESERPSGIGGESRGMPPEQGKLNASRFAFVVQVIEGESYAAEEEELGLER